MSKLGQLRGHCLCGAVTFRATPASEEMTACHCGMCRRWSGGPFMGTSCGTSLVIDEESPVGSYGSSHWGERMFCRACGSTLFWRGKESGIAFVSINAFDPVPDYPLAREIYVDDKPAAYAFAGSAQKLTGAELMALYAPKQD